MVIENLAPADIDAVVDIETRSFRQPWGCKSFMAELSCKESLSLVMKTGAADCPQTVIGYMCGRWIGSEMYILKLAVSENWRGRGIASRLLEESLRRALARKAASALLDVRLSNQQAISLYEKHGFLRVGTRPGYYLDTGEDALVMRKNLKEDV